MDKATCIDCGSGTFANLKPLALWFTSCDNHEHQARGVEQFSLSLGPRVRVAQVEGTICACSNIILNKTIYVHSCNPVPSIHKI